MSLQYDAKADLWSLGTIVFQCLTGKAPFQAQTPQALKAFYEKHANLSPRYYCTSYIHFFAIKILRNRNIIDFRCPLGTSKELSELLTGLLKRNAKERMNFEMFFNHKFLQRPEPPAAENLPGIFMIIFFLLKT